MKSRAISTPLKVSILAVPETTPMSVYGLYEVFAAVGSVWSRLTGEAVNVRRIVPKIVGRSRKAFRSSLGTPIEPHASASSRGIADVVVVTDIALPFDEGAPARWKAEIGWLRRQLEGGAQVCSVCTGAVLLAEAGLLDGRDAASHWSAAPLFRDRYPQIRFRPERILCQSGNMITTGGASSWEDLALHLIAHHCGKEEAVRIAKIFVMGDRTDGQLPFAVMTRPKLHADAIVKGCQSWLAARYTLANPVTRMVEKSGLPERTFKRRFKAATGYTLVEYVQALRVEKSKQMLEGGRGSVEEIAAAVGYEDPAFFRRVFRRLAGVTPSAYRQRYRQSQPTE